MLAIIWRVYYFLYFLLIKFISLLIWVVNKSYFIFRALSVWTAHHGHPPTEMKILKGLFGCCWKYFIPRPDADWECFGLRKIWTDYYSKCFLVRNRWNEAGIGFLGKNTKTSFTKKKIKKLPRYHPLMRENTKENYGDFLLCKTANCWLKLVVLSRRGMEMKIHYLSSSGKRLNWPLTVIPSNLPWLPSRPKTSFSQPQILHVNR